MVVDARTEVDGGSPCPVSLPGRHHDLVGRAVALQPDEGLATVDLHPARVAPGAVEPQVDRLPPAAVGLLRRHVDVGLVEWLAAVVESGPVRTAQHRCLRAPAQDERREVVAGIHEVEPLAVAGYEGRVRPSGRRVDRNARGRRRSGRAAVAARVQRQRGEQDMPRYGKESLAGRAGPDVRHDASSPAHAVTGLAVFFPCCMREPIRTASHAIGRYATSRSSAMNQAGAGIMTLAAIPPQRKRTPIAYAKRAL